MPHYKTREEYWRARGWGQLAAEVGRRTAAELQERGVAPDPESAVYKNTFDRLSARYRDELAATKKEKNRLEAEWYARDKKDTDEELLTYLREVVTTPEQLRTSKGIPGGRIIVKRFGGWQKALRLAGLLPPEEQAQTKPKEQ